MTSTTTQLTLFLEWCPLAQIAVWVLNGAGRKQTCAQCQLLRWSWWLCTAGYCHKEQPNSHRSNSMAKNAQKALLNLAEIKLHEKELQHRADTHEALFESAPCLFRVAVIVFKMLSYQPAHTHTLAYINIFLLFYWDVHCFSHTHWWHHSKLLKPEQRHWKHGIVTKVLWISEFSL